MRWLELFGSVVRGAEQPGDYDFLVEFQPMPPLEHGRAYLSLLAALERALGAQVDLLEREALRNHYFLESIAGERRVLFDVCADNFH